MVERIQNRKGFTIIEIMVVIALIGILAAVLVPKFGGVKDTAKNTGMLTNSKMVEAYVASVIDSYEPAEATNLGTAITNQFSVAGDNALESPYTGEEKDVVVATSATGAFSSGTGGAGAANDAGTIYVVIDTTDLHVYINGFDAKGNEIQSTRREVLR